jgi:hypothetical protein
MVEFDGEVFDDHVLLGGCCGPIGSMVQWHALFLFFWGPSPDDADISIVVLEIDPLTSLPAFIVLVRETNVPVSHLRCNGPK